MVSFPTATNRYYTLQGRSDLGTGTWTNVIGRVTMPGTGARLMIEGIEELTVKGGGYLLFSGCAAGDTAASIVLKVS